MPVDPKVIALMMENKEKANATGDTDPTPTKPITNQHRQAWNDFQSYLSKKGLAGSPELDKGDNGVKALEQYRKENPNTPLTKELVAPIQTEFQKYRQWALDNIKSGNGKFAPGVNEDNFMKELSTVDGIPGSKTTKHQFPSSYLNHLNEQGKVEKTDNRGFATTSVKGLTASK